MTTTAKALCALLLLALAVPTRAEEEDPRRWTATDTALQLTVVTLQLVDWGQTHWIRTHVRGAGEMNPLLGTHPSESRIRLEIGSAIVGHALVSYVLPQPYRRIWQCVWIGVEGDTIWANYRFTGGLSLSW